MERSVQPPPQPGGMSSPPPWPSREPSAPHPPRTGTDERKTVVTTAFVLVVMVVALIVLAVAAFYFVVVPFVGQTNRLEITVEGGSTTWNLTVSSTKLGLLRATTYLSVSDPNGTPSLLPTAFASLSWTSDHAAYNPVSPASSSVDIGDEILLDKFAYAAQSRIYLSDSSGVLFNDILA